MQKQLDQLIQQMKASSANISRKLSISKSEGHEFIEIDDIICCRAHGNCTYLYSLGHDPILLSKTLKAVEDEICDSKFIRCHQFYLVNKEQLYRYSHKKGSKLQLKNGKEIMVSRRKRAEVLKHLS
jgi:two-component system LytT family response regulator